MPTITYEASTDIRAPAEDAYALVTSELMANTDDPSEMAGQRPLVEGPLRVGFQWVQTYRHSRRECLQYWTVSELEPGRCVTQTSHHICMVQSEETRGGERWQFVDAGDGTATVTLSQWRHRPGLDGWNEKLFGANLRTTIMVGLLRRLQAVQFRVEHPREPQADLTPGR